MGLSRYYSGDLVVAALTGLGGGTLAFTIASAIIGSAGFFAGSPPIGYTASDVDTFVEVVTRRILGVFSVTAGISAALASYTVAYEREQGLSLVTLLLGATRRSYFLHRVLLVWLLYSTVATLSSLLGAALLEPFLIASKPAAAARVAAIAFTVSTIQLAASYIVSLAMPRAYYSLAASLTILLLADFTGLKDMLATLPWSTLASLALIAAAYALALTRPLR